jgi:hypothetical protein
LFFEQSQVAEAERFVNERLDKDKSSGAENLIIIYGAGHHSAGGKQLIKPAVMDIIKVRFKVKKSCFGFVSQSKQKKWRQSSPPWTSSSNVQHVLCGGFSREVCAARPLPQTIPLCEIAATLHAWR